MTNAEQKVVAEINEYKIMLTQTNSNKRKWQLNQHISKLRKELAIYRKLRYL